MKFTLKASADLRNVGFNAATDTFVGFIGQNTFVGTGPSTCVNPAGNARACGGPNGVVTDSSHLVWASDGNSTIKVLNPAPGTTFIKSLATGGSVRADELSYDSRDQIILIANDAECFVTFINVANQSVAGHFYYTDANCAPAAVTSGGHFVPGHTTAGGGIEQSVWDPETGLFYQAVPAGTSAGSAGFIDVFDPVSEKLVKTFSAPGCDGGPTGLALGPNQRFLGACGNGAIAIELHNGKVHKLVSGVGGADEVWFNPGDNNFYLAISGIPALGVVDADNDHVVAAPTGKGGHSVAAYAGNNQHLRSECGGHRHKRLRQQLI